MKPPLGHCPHEGCGKAGISMAEDSTITCSEGHTYKLSSTQNVAEGRSNQPGVKKSPPAAVVSGGSGFKKRAGNNTQTAEEANNLAGSPARPSPRPVNAISVNPSELDLDATSSGVVQDSPNSAPTARNISISEFIAQAKGLDESVVAHRNALKHIMHTLSNLQEQVSTILADGEPSVEEDHEGEDNGSSAEDPE